MSDTSTGEPQLDLPEELFSMALDNYRETVELRTRLEGLCPAVGQSATAEGVEAQARQEVVDSFRVILRALRRAWRRPAP